MLISSIILNIIKQEETNIHFTVQMVLNKVLLECS